MEDERTKELAYLLDREEQEVESPVEAAEEEVKETAEKKVVTKEEKKLEKQIMKKRSKERYPKKTVMNLNYKVDKTTGPTTVLLYLMFAMAIVIVVGKFGVLDVIQGVSSLEKELAGMEANVKTMTEAVKNYNAVKDEYNRYTMGYLERDEKVIDRLIILDMLEETVFAGCEVDKISIVEDSIYISYSGLDLEGTAALVKQLESYAWVEDVIVQKASLSYNEAKKEEKVSTTMIVETYATMEEVPANE